MDIIYNKDLFLENTKYDETEILTSDIGYYVADFEVSKIAEDKEEVFVYATGLMNVNDDKNLCLHTNNINDFISSLANLPNIESKVYFHNLSYDVTFLLLDLIVNYGFTQIRNKYKERFDGGLTTTTSKKIISYETVKPKKEDEEVFQIRPNSFNIVYNNGSFYKVDLYFNFVTYTDNRRKKKTRIKKVTLLDSYKLVSSSLQRIAKAFLNYDMPKDGINHNVIRETNYQLSDNEKIYVYEDVRVLKEFIKLVVIEGIQVNEYYNLKFNKLTTAGQSMNEYKKFLFSSFETNDIERNKAFEEGFKSLHDYKKYCEENNKKCNIKEDTVFNSIFPILHPNIDCFIRQSYYGGIVFKNSKLINTINDNIEGIVFDVNSLYPSVMREKLLPYGKPKYFEGNYNSVMDFIKKDYPLYIQKVRVPIFTIKSNKIPNIQIRESNLFRSTDYQENNSYFCKRTNKVRYEECIFTFTNIQLERFLQTYDLPLGIEYIEGYMFKGSYGLFDNYIDTFMELKKTGKGARRETAKLMLNSLYGKFGTNPCKEERIIQIEEGIFNTTNKNENGEYIEYLSESIYLPVATFITSYAREVLLSAIDDCYDRFLYCDTDSIHILGTEIPNIPIHENKLGYWKFEGKFKQAKYIGAKRYAELIETNDGDKWDIKCCGISSDIIKKLDDMEIFNICPHDNIKKELDNFYTKENDIYYYYDKECTKKVVGLLRGKKKKQVKGGILIQEQPYCITENMFAFFR